MHATLHNPVELPAPADLSTLYIGLKEVKRLLGCCHQTVYNMIKRGAFPEGIRPEGGQRHRLGTRRWDTRVVRAYLAARIGGATPLEATLAAHAHAKSLHEANAKAVANLFGIEL
jgi:predicted DNA-binding transcriptional regulator AlpA